MKILMCTKFGIMQWIKRIQVLQFWEHQKLRFPEPVVIIIKLQDYSANF